MNKKKSRKLSYLQTTSEYFLLMSIQNKCPIVIQDIQLKFNEILRKITNRTKTDSFKEADCNEFTKQIDRILYAVGEISLQNTDDYKGLDELKDKLWYLLETLEQYCEQNFKISIW